MASEDDKVKHEDEKAEREAHEPKGDDPLAGAPPAGKKKGGSKGFILLLAAAAVVALVVTSRNKGTAGGNNAPPAPPPGWAVGQTTDIELTLVAGDKRDLACGSKEVVAGKHCEFEAAKTAWSKGGGNDDKIILRPYMTTSQQPLMAAGLWSQLPPTLPTERFVVKCKYAIEGKLAKPAVRWHDDNVFYDETNDWFAGSLQGCAIQK